MNEETKPSIADSIRDTIAELSEADGSPNEQYTQAADTDAKPEPVEASDKDEDQGSEGTEDSGDDESTEGKDAEKGIQAPETWSEKDREAFDVLDEEGQKMLLGIHKNMEAGLTAGQAEVSEAKKRYRNFDSFFDSIQKNYAPNIDREQIESVVAQHLPNVLETYVALARDPVATLVQLADAYGAKEGLTEALSGYTEDEGSSEMRRENTLLKQRLKDIQFQATRAETSDAKEVIDTFKDEKTKDGVLAHPHFQEARDTMHILMVKDNDMSMESAYQKAVVIDKPDAARSAMEETIKADLEAERKKNAKGARRTPQKQRGKSSSTFTNGKGDEIPKDLGEHLRMEMGKQLDDMEGN